MENIMEILGEAKNAAILGHVRPDGDCVGSCLGLKSYLEAAAPGLKVQVYLEEFSEAFRFLKGAGEVSHDPADGNVYDLCIALDVSDRIWIMGNAGFTEGSPSEVLEGNKLNGIFSDSRIRYDNDKNKFVYNNGI